MAYWNRQLVDRWNDWGPFFDYTFRFLYRIVKNVKTFYLRSKCQYFHCFIILGLWKLLQKKFPQNTRQVVHCTEVRFVSFLSSGFIIAIVGHSSKSTGKETGKTHLCAVQCPLPKFDSSKLSISKISKFRWSDLKETTTALHRF